MGKRLGISLVLLILLSSFTFVIAQQTENSEWYYSRIGVASGIPGQVHSQMSLEMLLIQSGIGIENIFTFEQNGFPRPMTMSQVVMNPERVELFISLLSDVRSTSVIQVEIEETGEMPVDAIQVGMPVDGYGFILEMVEPSGNVRIMGQALIEGSSISFPGVYEEEPVIYAVTLIDSYFNLQLPHQSWALLNVEVEYIEEDGEVLSDVSGDNSGDLLANSDEDLELPFYTNQKAFSEKTERDCTQKTKENCEICCVTIYTAVKEGECEAIKDNSLQKIKIADCKNKADAAQLACVEACGKASPSSSGGSSSSSESQNNIVDGIISGDTDFSPNTNVEEKRSSSGVKHSTTTLAEARSEGKITVSEYIQAVLGLDNELVEEIVEEEKESLEKITEELNREISGMNLGERISLLLGIVTETGEEENPKVIAETNSEVLSGSSGCAAEGVMNDASATCSEVCNVNGKAGICKTIPVLEIPCPTCFLEGTPQSTIDEAAAGKKKILDGVLNSDKKPEEFGEDDYGKQFCYCDTSENIPTPNSPGTDTPTTTTDASCEDTTVEVAIRGSGSGSNKYCESARKQATTMCWGRASNNYPSDAKSLCSASCKNQDTKCDVVKFEPTQLTPPVCTTSSCTTQTSTTRDATGHTRLNFIETATSQASGTVSVTCDCEASGGGDEGSDGGGDTTGGGTSPTPEPNSPSGTPTEDPEVEEKVKSCPDLSTYGLNRIKYSTQEYTGSTGSSGAAQAICNAAKTAAKQSCEASKPTTQFFDSACASLCAAQSGPSIKCSGGKAIASSIVCTSSDSCSFTQPHCGNGLTSSVFTGTNINIPVCPPYYWSPKLQATASASGTPSINCDCY